MLHSSIIILSLLLLQSSAQELSFEPESIYFEPGSSAYSTGDDNLHKQPSIFDDIMLRSKSQQSEDPTTGIIFVQPDETLDCNDPPFQVYLLNESPQVIYVASFVSDEEIRHLIQQSEPNMTPSFVYQSGSTQVNQNSRQSFSAVLERDNIVRCIEQRLRRNQDWEPGMLLESMSIQRYEINGFFKHHYDYFSRAPEPDRVSTLNVFLQGNCTGGETHFPYFQKPEDPAWCQFIDCESDHEGVMFKPIAGNAVFWENLRADGTGYTETFHAGMPILSGTKIGLNIWTWSQPRQFFR